MSPLGNFPPFEWPEKTQQLAKQQAPTVTEYWFDWFWLILLSNIDILSANHRLKVPCFSV